MSSVLQTFGGLCVRLRKLLRKSENVSLQYRTNEMCYRKGGSQFGAFVLYEKLSTVKIIIITHRCQNNTPRLEFKNITGVQFSYCRRVILTDYFEYINTFTPRGIVYTF